MSDSVATVAASRVGRWAGFLSLGCAIHCMAMPFLVAVLPLIGMGFLLDERVETGLVGVSVVLAVASLCWGYRVHRKRRALLLLSAAVALIVAGRLSEGQIRETALVVTGAVTLATSQFLNRRLCRTCSCCHHGSATTI